MNENVTSSRAGETMITEWLCTGVITISDLSGRPFHYTQLIFKLVWCNQSTPPSILSFILHGFVLFLCFGFLYEPNINSALCSKDTYVYKDRQDYRLSIPNWNLQTHHHVCTVQISIKLHKLNPNGTYWLTDLLSCLRSWDLEITAQIESKQNLPDLPSCLCSWDL